MSALGQVTIRLNRHVIIGLRGFNLNHGRILKKKTSNKVNSQCKPGVVERARLSRPPSLPPSSQSKLGAGLSRHQGPDGGNLIARQGQDSALSMVLWRGRLDVIIKLDRTSFKSMPPRMSGDRQQSELKS